MAKPKEMSLQEFGIKYFDKRSKTRGNRNPIRNRKRKSKDELKKERIALRAAIKNGEHDGLLRKCGISGERGKFGKTISPAVVMISKQGGFDTFLTLAHLRLSAGMTLDNGRTILSVKRDGMGATIKLAQMGTDLVPYVHIFRKTTN